MVGEPISKQEYVTPALVRGGREPPFAAGNSDQRARGERRSADRLRIDREPQAGTGEHSFFLPPGGRGMALFLLAAFAMSALVAHGLPSLRTGTAALVAVALFGCGSLLAGAERRIATDSVLRWPLVAVGIVLPMAATGTALALWVGEGLPWQWAIGTLVTANAAAAVHFNLRIVSLFCAKIACWTGFAILMPSLLTFAALAGAAIALTLIGRLEWQAAERRRLAREARERVAARAEDILRSFEETGQGWFWETDRRGLVTYISPKAALVLGKTSEEVCGRPLGDIVDSRPGTNDAARALGFHLSARSAFRDLEVCAATGKDAHWWALTGRPVYDGFKNFCGFRGHGVDLTEQRRSEQQVSRLAHYDSLTGLANRVQMGEALEQILAAPSVRERACAVLMLDLDRFKHVNDTLGHPAGDALLKQVAQRLERAVAGAGRCGRLGGDEFQVIVPGDQDRRLLGYLAQEIITALSQPYHIDGQTVVIGASVGIALAPEHGTEAKELIRNVDLALYAAKDAGRGVHRFYGEHLNAVAKERAELEQELREAIAKGEFELHYQPVVATASEQIVGFEALMRWNHPLRGPINPARFLPIAEEAGLIDRLGHWALRTACADLARWPEQVRCAVNISAVQFANPELPTLVASALAHSGITPSRLELEITESVFLKEDAGTDAMIKALKRVGVRLALDDFGTGYASLGYVKRAPFDTIKIDGSFVRGAIEEGSRNGAIIASITNLAEALRMDTIAEGVETLGELQLVRLLGCSHVQGYVYSEPVTAADAATLVAGDRMANAEGRQSARAVRQNLLRRVVVVHDGTRHNVTLRNISQGGAMFEGIWNVPVGSDLRIELAPDNTVSAQVRWSRESQAGVEFHVPLKRRADGSFAVFAPEPRPRARTRAAGGGVSAG
jgi:diguanylate cyclase (GGDEF)-like protein/PAS domain S-box-containing protein